MLLAVPARIVCLGCNGIGRIELRPLLFGEDMV